MTVPSSPPLHILVAGYGYLGAPLARLLSGRGHRVTALGRSDPKGNAPPGIATAVCDISDPAAVSKLAAQLGTVDRIIHCASSSGSGEREVAYRKVYLDGCRNLFGILAPDRLVFTGSTSVYAQTDGSTVDEDSPADPASPTGRILRAAEEAVLAAGHRVARLAGIYGPGRSFLLRRYLEGASTIDGESADAAGRWINQIHRDDAAEALALLATSADVRTGIFNVCDDEPLRQRAFYERLADALGSTIPPVRPADTWRKRGCTDKRVANARLHALGWTPRYSSYFAALRDDPELLPSIRAQKAGGTPD